VCAVVEVGECSVEVEELSRGEVFGFAEGSFDEYVGTDPDEVFGEEGGVCDCHGGC